mmetsp:Transcript_22833/g.56400  ORF Transcript_22833/g.56400 Transcript_22833/m.56400 type:complete len:263 (+) Transcript_22833:428-1216(+)
MRGLEALYTLERHVRHLAPTGLALLAAALLPAPEQHSHPTSQRPILTEILHVLPKSNNHLPVLPNLRDVLGARHPHEHAHDGVYDPCILPLKAPRPPDLRRVRDAPAVCLDRTLRLGQHKILSLDWSQPDEPPLVGGALAHAARRQELLRVAAQQEERKFRALLKVPAHEELLWLPLCLIGLSKAHANSHPHAQLPLHRLRNHDGGQLAVGPRQDDDAVPLLVEAVLPRHLRPHKDEGHHTPGGRGVGTALVPDIGDHHADP